MAQVVTKESPVPGLSRQQYERLMQQLKFDAEPMAGNQQPKPSVNMAGNPMFERPWVIDLGAIEHITHYKNLLRKTSISNRHPVCIHNGINIPIKGLGNSMLLNGMKIEKVLHIPDFKCNLLSFSRLTKEYNYAITFVADFCVI